MGVLRTVLLLVLPPVAVLVAYGISTAGTSSEEGRVPIPGEAVVELTRGTTALYYEEARNLEEGSGTPVIDDADFLEIPPDLEVTIRPRGTRDELLLDPTSFGSVVEDDEGSRKVFAKVEVPEDGSYVVVVAPIAAEPAAPASVTLGEDALTEFLPWGLAALGACALGGLVALGFALRDRRQKTTTVVPNEANS